MASPARPVSGLGSPPPQQCGGAGDVAGAIARRGGLDALASVLSAWGHALARSASVDALALRMCARPCVLLESAPGSGKSRLGSLVAAALLRGSTRVFSAVLACDGDTLVCEGVSEPPSRAPSGLYLEGEDRVAPVCAAHAGAGFATHAELFERWHAQPALLRAGDVVRGALLDVRNGLAMGDSTLLFFSIDDVDLLHPDDDEAIDAAASACTRGLRDLLSWASCGGCWHAARCDDAVVGDAAIGLPPPTLFVTTCSHAAAAAGGGSGGIQPRAPVSSFLSLPFSVQRCTAPALLRLARDVEQAAACAGGGHASISAALISALPLLAGGRGSGDAIGTSAFASREVVSRALPVGLWLELRGDDDNNDTGASVVSFGEKGDSSSCDPVAVWAGVAGFADVKRELGRRVIAPLLAALFLRVGGGEGGGGGCSGDEGSSGVLPHPSALPSLTRVLLSRLRAATMGSGMVDAGGGGAVSDASLLRLLTDFAAASGCAPPSHVLLVGPPGSGKTLFARSLAATSGTSFLHVACPRLLSRYVGASESALRRVFACARAASPCVLLLDDIEAIAGLRRGGAGGSGGGGGGGGADAVLDRLLATLLNEMDGVGTSSTAPPRGDATTSPSPPIVIVVATATSTTTHAPLSASWGCVDAALLRPGRLEVHIHLPPPSLSDRLDILSASPAAHLLAQPPHGPSLSHLAHATHEWSAAHVAALLPEAALLASLGGVHEEEVEEEDVGSGSGETDIVLTRELVLEAARSSLNQPLALSP